MEYIPRLQEKSIHRALDRGKSVLLLGARQTGKSTLIERIPADLVLSLAIPQMRQRYEQNPGVLAGEIAALTGKGSVSCPLVVLDEVQKVPAILDVVQHLIDHGKAKFILTGSSARKLRRGPNVNLLPGRIVSLKLDPLTLQESPTHDVLDRLLYGSLPGILAVEAQDDRQTDLESYVTTYLEEEIRAEGIVRNLGSFSRFLELAASESGKITNLRKLSQEIGVAHTTIAEYYQILEDCLVAHRIDPLTHSATRKKLSKSSKYLFFDLGVRRIAAREGTELPRETLGLLFEQFIGLELLRCARVAQKKRTIHYWRDPGGPEIDWVVADSDQYIPIEVKWTQSPSPADAKHLSIFLSEYRNAKRGYVICQTPRKIQLAENILALPWQEIGALTRD